MTAKDELRKLTGKVVLAFSVFLLLIRFFVNNLQNEDSLPSFEFLLLSLCLVALTFAVAYRRFRLPFGVVVVSVVILALTLIAAVRAPVKWDAVLLLLHTGSTVAFFVVVLTLSENTRNIRLLLYALLALGVAVVFYAFYQSFFALKEVEEFLRERPDFVADERLRRGVLERAGLRDAFGLFVLPNGLSAFSAVLLFLSGVALVERIRAQRKADAPSAFLLLCAGASAAGMYLSGAKGGVAVLLFVLLLGSVWRLAKKRRLLAREHLAPLVVVVAAAVVVSVVTLAVPPEKLPASVSVRTMYWRSGFAMLTDNPLGVGLGNFKHYYGAYKDVRAEDVKFAHNFLVTFGTEAGLAAAAFLLLLLFLLWRRLSAEWKDVEAEPIERTDFLFTACGGVLALPVLLLLRRIGGSSIVTEQLLMAMFGIWFVLFYLFWRCDFLAGVRRWRGCIIGALFLGLFTCLIDFNAYEGAFAFTLALLSAVALALGGVVRYADINRRRSLFYACGTAALAILLAVPLPSLLRADAVRQNGRALVEDGVRAGGREGEPFIEEGVELLESGIYPRWNRVALRERANALLRLFRVRRTEERWRSATSAFRELLVVNPFDSEARRSLAFLLFEKGAVGEAVVEMEKAIDVNGTVPKYWFELGCLLLKEGDEKGASRAFSEALRLDGVDGAWNRLSGAERRHTERLLGELRKSRR